MLTPNLFKLTPEDVALFDALQAATGQTRVGVLRLALRVLAKREKVAVPTTPKKTLPKSNENA